MSLLTTAQSDLEKVCFVLFLYFIKSIQKIYLLFDIDIEKKKRGTFMQFKFSNYNHMLESSAFDLILYNFRTQNSIKIPSKHPAKAFLQNRESFHAKKNKWFDILLKKEFIVDEEFDEASWCILKHRETIYGNDTLFVEILPTNDCNFRCSYCFERHTPNFIDMESETKIIRFLEQNIPK